MLSKNTDWILALWKLTVLWTKAKPSTLAISNVLMKKKPQPLKKSDVSENRSDQRNGNLHLKRQKYSANFPQKESNVSIYINILNKISDIFFSCAKIGHFGRRDLWLFTSDDRFACWIFLWRFNVLVLLYGLQLTANVSKIFFFNFHPNGYRRKRPKVDACIFDSALSHTRRSDASEKKRRK